MLETNRPSSRAVRARRILILLCMLLQLAWVQPSLATDYWGPPYTVNSGGSGFGSIDGAINSVADPEYALIGKNNPNGADCLDNTCTVVISEYDPTPTGGLVAKVGWFINGQNVSTAIIAATDTSVEVQKNVGASSGCNCKQTQGGSTGGSSPHGSSGDSALDAQSPGPQSNSETDPINAANGNKYEQDTDFRSSK